MYYLFTGTHQIHFIKPICKGQVEVRSYSSSSEFRKESTSLLQGNTISLTSLKGYCIAAYDEHWYLACILEVKHDSNEVSLSFLHPHGPAPSFVFPSPQDVLIIDVSDILMSVSPVTKTGRTYTLSKVEYGKAENMFASRNKKCKFLKIKCINIIYIYIYIFYVSSGGQ